MFPFQRSELPIASCTSLHSENRYNRKNALLQWALKAVDISD